MNKMLGSALLLAGTCLSVQNAFALDYNDLEVYPYATPAQGETELESSSVYQQQGDRTDAFPANGARQPLETFEVSRGLTDHTEIAGYLDAGRPYGSDWQYDGARVHLRHRFFEKGELPVDFGGYVEYETHVHDADSREMELRGIVEKDFGKWTVDFNPILSKVIKGANVANGWEAKYAASLRYRLNETIQPRLDLFGDIGPMNHQLPWEQQAHLVSPAVDINFSPRLHAMFGVGYGRTDATAQRLVRARLEYEWY